MRSFSPSLTLTWTLTVSPGANGGTPDLSEAFSAMSSLSDIGEPPTPHGQGNQQGHVQPHPDIRSPVAGDISGIAAWPQVSPGTPFPRPRAAPCRGDPAGSRASPGAAARAASVGCSR